MAYNRLMGRCLMAKRLVDMGHYTRQVELRTVEFVCQHCGRHQSYTMYPGPTPKWCWDCYREVRRTQARLRKRRQRARQKKLQAPDQFAE
jgi:hypothetical protein